MPTISAAATGTNTKPTPGSFGIQISYSPVSPQAATLPNSVPQAIKCGDIKVS